MRYLVLGATGMLGHQFMRTCHYRGIEVFGTVRSKSKLPPALINSKDLLFELQDATNLNKISTIIEDTKVDAIVNCIGIVKQSHLASDHVQSISINSLLPHQLNSLCVKHNIRLVHISTDCVFDGTKGMYSESDQCNATDLYGKSKHLGEVDYGNTITLRTSIIGHEASDNTHGLLEWFLAQNSEVEGFTQAYFSGLTTNNLSNTIISIIEDSVLPSGLYHVASKRISKYDLLKIISEVYNFKIGISPSDNFKIDRSLDSSNFENLTHYEPLDWLSQITGMQDSTI